MTPTPSRHRAPLEALGLSGAPVDRLCVYLDALGEWSRRVNLTAARTPAERVAIIVAGVLPVRGIPEPGTLLDVGSGNGTPGLVLALLREDLDVTLLEPRTRRWAFLREAARRAAAAGGREIRVVRGRHDSYGGPPARTVTVRALSLSLSELAPLVAPGGRIVVLGGTPRPEGPFEEDSSAARGDARVFRHRATDVPRGTSGSA